MVDNYPIDYMMCSTTIDDLNRITKVNSIRAGIYLRVPSKKDTPIRPLKEMLLYSWNALS